VASRAPRTFPGIGVVDLVTKLDVATLRIDHCITSVEVITCSVQCRAGRL
jgi:hypothetical protein